MIWLYPPELVRPDVAVPTVNHELFYFAGFKRGKQDPKGSGVRVKQPPVKGDTCHYYAANHVRQRYKGKMISLAQQAKRDVEHLISARRKAWSQLCVQQYSRIKYFQYMEDYVFKKLDPKCAQQQFCNKVDKTKEINGVNDKNYVGYIFLGFATQLIALTKEKGGGHFTEEDKTNLIPLLKYHREYYHNQAEEFGTVASLLSQLKQLHQVKVFEERLEQHLASLKSYGISVNEFFTAFKKDDESLQDYSDLNDIPLQKRAAVLQAMVQTQEREMHRLMISHWHSSAGVAGLMQQLKVHGALLVCGLFGGGNYQENSLLEKESVPATLGLQDHITLYGWKKGSHKYSHSESLMAHSVVVVGVVRQGYSRFKQDCVLFRDPVDASVPGEAERIYIMSYARFEACLSDLQGRMPNNLGMMSKELLSSFWGCRPRSRFLCYQEAQIAGAGKEAVVVDGLRRRNVSSGGPQDVAPEYAAVGNGNKDGAIKDKPVDEGLSCCSWALNCCKTM